MKLPNIATLGSWLLPLVFSSAAPAQQAVPFPGDRIANDQPPFLAGVTVDHETAAYREGDRLQVEFKAERGAFLYLIYHQADGQSRLLFPNESQPNNCVPANQATLVPDPRQPLRFRIQPPFGSEVLQVIASLEPLPPLDGLVTKSGRAPVVSQAVLDDLRQRLARDLTTWTEHRVQIRTEAKQAPTPPRTAARVGLFIGIGKYLDPKSALPPAGAAAKRMHQLMIERGGLDPANAKLLLDEQATKANIQELITHWLPSVSQPADTVFIYFSGHTGQIDSNDPSEPDGLDEALCPYDFNPAGERQYRDSCILDDTLARWLQSLAGRQVVLIFDTCHSGGLAQGKGLDGGARLNAAGKASRPPLDFFSDEAMRVKDISQLNSILLASSASDELSWGHRDKMMYFSACLIEAMTRADAPHPLTVQAAFDDSRKLMKTLVVEVDLPKQQEPTMTDNVLLPIILVP